jgi:hypothetical protein
MLGQGASACETLLLGAECELDREYGSPRPVSRLLLYLDMMSRQIREKSLLWFLVSQPSGLLLFLSGRSNYSLLFQISYHFINNILFYLYGITITDFHVSCPRRFWSESGALKVLDGSPMNDGCFFSLCLELLMCRQERRKAFLI